MAIASASPQRIKLVRQVERSECALAAVAMIAGAYGHQLTLAALRRRFTTSARGMSVGAIVQMADRLGMAARPVTLPLEQVSKLRLPAMLHWDFNHWVVLEEVGKRGALIHDPEGRSRRILISELSRHFTGVAVEIVPTVQFEPINEGPRLRLKQLWSKAIGIKRSLLQVAILSLMLQLYVIVAPYYLQVAIDTIVPTGDLELLTVLALGFIVLALMNVGAESLRSLVLLSAGSSVSFGIALNLTRQLFRLPVDWFEKRHVGDVLSRFQSIAPIKGYLTDGAVAIVIDGLMATVTLAMMLVYSPLLAAITVAAALMYLVSRVILFRAQRSAEEDVIVAGGKEQSNLIEAIRGIVTLRLFNRESTRLASWQTSHVNVINAAVSASKIGILQRSTSMAIFACESVVVVWLAVRLVIQGGFTVGMLFTFMAYRGNFTARMVSLIEQFISFKMIDLHLERLSDIALAAQDHGFEEPAAEVSTLEGRIQLHDVTFRYGSDDPMVLKGVNLSIDAREHVAITGPSGGGKSTLVKILLGLVEPTTGKVRIDGVELNKYGHRNYQRQVAAVLQEDHLFAGSIAENIALFDEDIDMAAVVNAATIAALHDDVMVMTMQYDSLVGDMGSSLSGGQRQRLLLSRAIYRNPRLLIMDEGTSHLDARREAEVNSAIECLGMTRIMIAHRIETIRSADRVFALDGGVLTEVTDFYKKL